MYPVAFTNNSNAATILDCKTDFFIHHSATDIFKCVNAWYPIFGLSGNSGFINFQKVSFYSLRTAWNSTKWELFEKESLLLQLTIEHWVMQGWLKLKLRIHVKHLFVITGWIKVQICLHMIYQPVLQNVYSAYKYFTLPRYHCMWSIYGSGN